MKIIYPQDGGIAVIWPAEGISVEEVALKDVPAGLPFLIVDDSVIPAERDFRAAWEADFSTPDGFGIGHEAWAAQQ